MATGVKMMSVTVRSLLPGNSALAAFTSLSRPRGIQLCSPTNNATKHWRASNRAVVTTYIAGELYRDVALVLGTELGTVRRGHCDGPLAPPAPKFYLGPTTPTPVWIRKDRSPEGPV